MAATIHEALAAGAALAISVSGGKDSQAMARYLARERSRNAWPGPAELIHADLGRAEWPQTPGHVEKLAAEVGLPLTVVRRTRGDLLSRIEDRLNTVSTVDPSRPAKPFWPSAAQRYCTSDLKRDPILKYVRSRFAGVVVSAQGMRAQESPGRARREVVAIERRASARHMVDLPPDESLRAQRERGGRLILTWLPIHTWTADDVWRELGSDREDLARRQNLYRGGLHDEAFAGWQAHPAYVMGNERLSCAFCVLGSRADLVNGARHNPDLLRQYIELEKRSTYSFREGLSLAEIAKEAGVA